MSPSALVLGPRTPVLGSESTKLIDANEPSVAFGWNPGPVGVQRRPGKISLGLHSGETPTGLEGKEVGKAGVAGRSFQERARRTKP